MKMLIPFLVFAAVAAAAEPGRLRDLPPEQLRAAGLHKLTAEEFAALEALWEQRAEAARSEVRKQVAADRQPAGPAASTDHPARAEDGDAADSADAPGWLKALRTLKRVSEEPDKARALESRLAGDFKGWSGRTLFHLENGQVWQQVGGGEYYDKVLKQPRVKIYPAAMGAYWLQIEGLRQRVRVKPYKLE